MRVVVLGAGASKSYARSSTGLAMPLASEIFETFEQLPLSRDPLVLSHSVIGYVKQTRGIPFEVFLRSRVDVEAFHSEVREALQKAIADGDHLAQIANFGAYVQLTFLLAFTINQVQNGPPSEAHLALARHLRPDDVVLTFNWDTLMDRALAIATDWTPDVGYGVEPRMLYRDSWRRAVTGRNQSPTLLKLHGSTNWLTSYVTLEAGAIRQTQTSDPSTLYVFEAASRPYDTYEGRYMPGYESYSYGYYPTNIPDDRGKAAPPGMVLVRMTPRYPWIPPPTAGDAGLISMPLLIPPVMAKDYGMFGALFSRLWQAAQESLSRAEKVILIGYSFPRTDHASRSLFKTALATARGKQEIVLLNPEANRLADLFDQEFGVPRARLRPLAEPFSGATDIQSLLG